MSHDVCPKCGADVYRTKDTFSGEIWVDFSCTNCNWSAEENWGVATWKAMSDAREDEVVRDNPASPLPPDDSADPPSETGRPWQKAFAGAVFLLIALSLLMFFRSGT